jgi:hypothetical protein
MKQWAKRGTARRDAAKRHGAWVKRQLGSIDGALEQQLAVEILAALQGFAEVGHGRSLTCSTDAIS